MSDDYEVGITLALDDDVSVGIAAIQRDLLRLDQAIGQSAARLTQLRAIASVALADADADVRRAAGLTAAPAPRVAVQPKAAAAAPSDERPAAAAVVRTTPAASLAAAAAPVEPAAVMAPVPRPAAVEGEPESRMTPVAPAAVPPLVAARQAPTDEPARHDGMAAPAASAAAPVVAYIERAEPRSTAAPVLAAPAPVSSSTPLALRTDAPNAPAPSEAGSAARPVAPTPPSTPALGPAPTTAVVVPAPAMAAAPSLPPTTLTQRSAAPMPAAEQVTRREMPRMPELAAIGRSVMPSRTMDAEQAAVPQGAMPPLWPDGAVSRHDLGAPAQARAEAVGGERRPGAPLDEPRRRDARNETMAAAMPMAYAPAAPPAATREQPTISGDVILDGQKVGRWMSDRMTRDAGRPPNGPTGFDPSRSPAWPGATVA